MKQRYIGMVIACSLMATTALTEQSNQPETPETLRVAACQIINGPNLDVNLDKILHWIEVAAQDNVDVILFPEASLPGYVSETGYYADLDRDALASAESKVIEASRQYNIAVVLGSVHWEDEELYNSLLAIDKGGVVRGRYSKSYLAEPWSRPGETLPVYSLAGVDSCFVICHDIRYPGLVRLPVIEGAQICYFSSHESGLLEEHKLSAYQAMPISRATENTIYLVMANASASRDDLSGSHGNSKIIHPDGNIIIEAGYFDERLVTATIKIRDASRAWARKSIEQQSPISDWLQKGSECIER